VEALVRNSAGFGLDSDALGAEAYRLSRRTDDQFLHHETAALLATLAASQPLDGETAARNLATPILPPGAPDELAEVDLTIRAFFGRVVTAIRIGDLEAFHEQVGAAEALSSRWSSAMWFVLQWRGCEAAWRGQFTEAKRLAVALRDLGAMPGMNLGADGLIGWVQFEQGRVDAPIRAVEALHALEPRIPFLAAYLARLHTERGDLRQARRWFDQSMQGAPGSLPRDFTRTLTLLLLADAAVDLEDAGAAQILHDELRPHAGEIIVGFTGSWAAGYADRALGRLAALLGDHHAAIDHSDRAVEASRDFGAPPWLARALLDRARLPGRAAADVARDADHARRLATDLGMTRVASAAGELR
jgi:tetratricopeptide (TPR) repeat protein